MASFNGGSSSGESNSAISTALRETRQTEAAFPDLDLFPEPIVRPKFRGDDPLLRSYMKEEFYVGL